MALPAAVLSVLVNANTGGAAASLTRLDKQLKKTAAESNTMAAKVEKASKKSALVFGAMAGGSVYAAMKFESAFAEVRKTVDTNEKGFDRIEKGLRRLSTQIPVSANSLANLAGEAGALGVKSRDIVRFTKTAAMLGTTTNLSAEEAATSLARLGNIMESKGRKAFERMGSTLVDLGNKGASTEDEIVNMALRIAGAGKTLGLTESEVLGLSSALANVGIRAEMGGSAISRVMLQMQEAIAKGGPELANFAEITGVSVDQFERQFAKSAPRAIAMFASGLGKINKEGKPVISTLKGVNLSETRVRDTLLRIAGNTKQFTEAQGIAGKAWQKNTALAEEAHQRYKTFESQLKLLGNQLVEIGIGAGQKLIPVLMDLTGILRNPAVLQFTTSAVAMAAALGTVVFIGGKVVAAFRVLTATVIASRAAIMTTFALISRHPLGALVVGIGLAATAFYAFTRSSNRAADSQRTLAQVIHRQKEILGGLAEASKRVERAKHREKEATKRVKDAEDHLATTRRKYGPNSQQAIEAEAKLAREKNRSARASKNVRNAERLYGAELRATKALLPPLVREQAGRVRQLKNERRSLVTLLDDATRAYERGKGPLSDVSRLKGALAKKSQETDRAVRSQNETFLRAAREVNPKFAEGLRKTAHRTEEMGNAIKPTQRRLRVGFGQIEQNLARMVNTSGKGLGVYGENVNSTLGSFGAKKLEFQIKKFKAAEGKQRGGLLGAQKGTIVPGSAPGDRHTLALNGVPIARVESGEKIAVVNRKAAQREMALNKAVPRFQAGGLVQALGPYDIPPIQYDPNHAGGNSHLHISMVSVAAAKAIAAQMRGMGWMIGEAPWAGGVTVAHQDPGHYSGSAFDANTAADETRAQVAAVAALLGGKGGAGGAGLARIARLILSGPAGPLRNIGQGGLDKARKAANAFLAKQRPTGGLALGSFAGKLGKSQLVQLWRSANGFGDANLMAAIALAESGGDPGAVGPATDSGHAKGLWQIMMPLHDAIVQGNVFDPVVNARAAGAILKSEGLGAWEAYSNGNYSQFLQKGGMVTAEDGSKVPRSFYKDKINAKATNPVGMVAPGLQAGKPKFKAIERQMKRLKAMGLSKKRLASLEALSGDAAKFSEFAQNASSLTIDNGEGDPILGMFGGGSEADWLNKQLGALAALRNSLIQAHEEIVKRREQITKAIERAKKQLAAIRKAIKKAEERKRDLKASLHKAEAKLESAKKAKNQGAIRQANTAIYGLRSAIDTVEGQQRERRSLAGQIAKRVIPGLIGKRQEANTTRGEILGTGGDKFIGLQQVQGLSGPMEVMGTLPPVGVLGGDILSAQLRLRELGEKTTTRAPDTEKQELTAQLIREANLRTAVAERQFDAFRQFDKTYPVMGAFAKGGVALVGEKGPELAHLPSGTRIHSAGDTERMLDREVTIVVNGSITGTPAGVDPIETFSGGKRLQQKIRKTPLSGVKTPGGARR